MSSLQTEFFMRQGAWPLIAWVASAAHHYGGLNVRSHRELPQEAVALT